jgi:hypothetical protein
MIGNTPLYIAAQLESEKTQRRIWLPLPVTKQDYNAVIAKLDPDGYGVRIVTYAKSLPYLKIAWLMKTPLAVNNHLAARLYIMKQDDLLKLLAINDSDYYFNLVEQFVDYSYQTDKYTLLPGVCNEEALGEYYIGNPNHVVTTQNIRECLDRYAFGKRLAEMEDGVFTPHGYLTSEIGWDLRPQDTPVPEQLNLKGSIGEDLYGNWEESDYGV